MRFQILMAFVLFSSIAFSQNKGQVTITSKGNLPMFLLVNDALQHSQATDTIHIYFSYGSYNIKVIYTDSLTFIEKNIFINSDEHNHYEFYQQDSLVNIRLIGQYLGTTRGENLLDYTSSSNGSYQQLLSIFNDENFVKKLLTGANDYQGKKGCENPDYINKYELIEKINEAYLTKQKTQIIEKAFNEKCLKTSDIYDILNAIDYEDIRLELLQKYTSSIFDLDNFFKLSDLFSIKQHREAFNKLKNTL